MKKAKVYSANVNGTFTQLKAYKKSNAVKCFQQLDSAVKKENVYVLDVQNSQEAPIEDLYPELYL